MGAVGPGDERPTRARTLAMTGAIATLTVAAPAAFGGVHPPTQIALAFGSLVVAALYVLHRGRRGVPAVPFAGIAALGVAATLFQLLPLPAVMVSWLSPAAYGLRSEVSAARLMPLTLDVAGTSLALARGITCLVLLLVVAAFVSTPRRARSLLTVIALVGAGLALVGIAQRVGGAHKIYGIYEPQARAGAGFFGSFVDVNHAASLMALSALVACGLAVSSRGPTRIAFALAALAATAGIMVTASRAGMAGLAAGGFVLALVLMSRSVGYLRAFAGATVLLLVLTTVALWTNEGMRARLSQPPDQLLHNQKVRGWMDGLRMAAAYKWTGVGRGAFEAPINAYREGDQDVRLVYPENVVVQLASEWGFPFALLVIALVMSRAVKVAPMLKEARPGAIGAACGVAVVIAHDFADFGLETIGLALPTVVALGVVVGVATIRTRHRDPERKRLSRSVALALVGVGILLVGVAAQASRHTLEADYRRLEADQKNRVDREALARASARHPADDYLELLQARAALQAGDVEAMRHINRALSLHPSNWQAHRMAARVLVAANHPQQAALEYRLAIACGMMADTKELVRLLGPAVVEASPQTPQQLLEWARALYEIGKVDEADASARRAVALADGEESVRAARLRLTIDVTAPVALRAATDDLAKNATRVESFALVARGWSKLGNQAASNAAIETGMRAHPSDASLILLGARLRLDAGDLPGARSLLTRSSRATLTLEHRHQAEELLAEVAERAGDKETAVMARTRARLIADQLRDMTFGGPRK
ncbi:MAG: O-antigen polymerase family protein [Myxococcales bacterium]|nr:O-antigen polymerase family protein [Myxococcales bacterium]